jgi:hypothetical protein
MRSRATRLTNRVHQDQWNVIELPLSIWESASLTKLDQTDVKILHPGKLFRRRRPDPAENRHRDAPA